MKQKKKKGSFKWKLIIVYAVLFVFVILAIDVSILTSIRDNLYTSRLKEMRYRAGRISDTMVLADIDDEETIITAFSQTTSALLTEGGQEDGLQMFLLNAQGELLYAKEETLTASDLYSRPVIAAVNGQETTSLYVHQIPGEHEDQFVGDLAMPVFKDGKVIFILLLRQSVLDIETTLWNNLRMMVIISVGAILMTMLLSYGISSGITRPILALTKKASQFATGELENADALPLRDTSSDEIEELENNFNQMARDLSRILSEANSERNKLAAIFLHMADGLVVYDLNGEVIQSNLVAKKLMGSNVCTQPFHEMFPAETFKSLFYNPSGVIEQRMMHLDEHYIQVEFAAYRNEEELPEGLIVVLQDVTDQQHLEEMQREFVANVSHELRTPITTIKSYVETMLDGGDSMDSEMQQSFLSTINQESDRMNSLIGELLELSRMDNRQLRLRKELKSAYELLSDCVERYQILAERKNQQMRTLNSADGIICVDLSRIEQVIRNLLMNAVNYSPVNAKIDAWVTVEETKQEVIMHIRDTGIGIPAKEQKRIFDRFYRVDKARSRSSGGTGLGLSIARELMELHGGRISVDSIPGQGSTFHLIFPMADEGEEQQDES